MWKWFAVLAWLSSAALAAGPASQPSTRPADPDLDFVLGQGRPPAPASKPPEKPASQPFAQQNNPDGARAGVLTLSNGEKIRGKFGHTGEKPVRVWVEAQQEYRDVPYKLIASFEAKVTSEIDEKEWHFKESGSDIKEFTGKTYPVRETQYTLTLLNGQTITGGIVEPIYLERREGPYTFSLLKRDKGPVGQPIKKLIYVQRIEFDDAKVEK